MKERARVEESQREGGVEGGKHGRENTSSKDNVVQRGCHPEDHCQIEMTNLKKAE
jgi:hypothetical protein